MLYTEKATDDDFAKRAIFCLTDHLKNLSTDQQFGKHHLLASNQPYTDISTRLYDKWQEKQEHDTKHKLLLFFTKKDL